MANLILVTGAAGRVGGVGRAVTELLLQQAKAVRAMVRNEDERAQALRDMGAEVVVGNLLDLHSMHRVIDGCDTMYFGMSDAHEGDYQVVKEPLLVKIDMAEITLA
jgi:uncharacterized protein YbjT (DUF2867 family)